MKKISHRILACLLLAALVLSLEGSQPVLKADAEEQKAIYLTFDDGPGPYTEKLLDILDMYHVKATFFVVNTVHIDLVKRMVQEGHTVGCHSYCHQYAKIYSGEESYFEDLHAIEQIVAEKTGNRPTLLRFPGGSSNTVSRRYREGIMTRLTHAVQAQDYQYVDWNVDSFDGYGTLSAGKIVSNVTRGIEKLDSAVVLLHDIYKSSVDAVESIIEWGLDHGYVFLPLTDESPVCHHGVNN